MSTSRLQPWLDVLRSAGLTELQDVSASDVPISEGVGPQEAVRASLQDVPFVVWQIFFQSTVLGYFTRNLLSVVKTNSSICSSLTAKCGSNPWDGCIYLPRDAPVTEKQGMAESGFHN